MLAVNANLRKRAVHLRRARILKYSSIFHRGSTQPSAQTEFHIDVVLRNFVQFNLMADGGALYGSHPWHWYLEGLAGGPALQTSLA